MAEPTIISKLFDENKQMMRWFIVRHLGCKDIIVVSSVKKDLLENLFSQGHFKFNLANFGYHLKKQKVRPNLYALPLKNFTRQTLMDIHVKNGETILKYSKRFGR